MNKYKIIRKITILCLLSFCGLSALDWRYDTSTRIEALGFDFAGVLKDLQTDIEVRNPAYLEGYRAISISHKGYYSSWSMPLNFSWFDKHFGLALRYGGHYYLNADTQYPRDQLSRLSVSGFWAKNNFGLQYDFFLEDLRFDYDAPTSAIQKENFTFHTISFGYHLSQINNLDLRCRLAFGVYDSTYSEFIGGQLEPIAEANFFIPSFQVGLSYEKEVLENSSLNLLVDLGGPVSAFETKSLPISFQSTVKRNAQGVPTKFDFLANSFSTRIAGAISYQPDASWLIAMGLNELWNGSKARVGSPVNAWINIFSLPLAIEWQATGNIAVRGGVRAEYYYQYLKQPAPQVVSYWARLQNFGLGFRLFQSWYLDLTSFSNLLAIESIDLSLRKEF